MSSIIQYTHNFIKGATSSEYDIPPPVQIALCIGAAILLTILVAMFYPMLRVSRVRDSFMWYYFIAMFNLINICLILWFYHRKTTGGDLIGESGDIGLYGPKGLGGSVANCSLCQTNLYIRPARRSATTAILDLDTLTAASLGPQLPESIQQLASSTSHTLFDYSAMIDQLLIGDTNTIADNGQPGSLGNIQNIAENSEYTLLSHLNNTQGIGNMPAIHQTDLSSGTIGYLALGDSITSDASISPQSYVINGDIRATDVGGYEVRGIITTATTHSAVSSRNTNAPKRLVTRDYQILKPRSIKGYDTIGEIITPLDDNPPKLHYAMANKDCLETIPSSQLQLAYIYPLKDGSGYLSFWNTGFGTWHTRRALIMSNPQNENNTNNSKQSRRRLHRLIDQSSSPKDLTQRLASIPIPQYVAAAAILGHTIEYTQFNIGNILTDHWQTISSAITPAQLQGLKQYKQRPQDIASNDIPAILTILGNIATSSPTEQPNKSNKSGKSTKSSKRTQSKNNSRIKSLYDLTFQGGDLRDTPQETAAIAYYKFAQDYEKMRVVISDAGVQIENIGSLLDLVLVLTGLRTDGDLGRFVYMSDISPTTTRILAICNALMPPSARVYRPKDSCLVSASLDTDRIAVITRLQKAMRDYQQALSSANNIVSKSDNINSGSGKGSGDSKIDANVANQINRATEDAFEELAVILGSVPEYMTKIQSGKFNEFSNSRLEKAAIVFEKLSQQI